MSSVVGSDSLVPLVQGGHTRYVNLDYAASAPALVEVAEHVTRLLPHYSSVHRGAGYQSRLCTSVYEEARATVAAFVGARPEDGAHPGDVVVFGRHTTDALALLAHATPGEAVVLDIEHHANLLPWLRRGDRVVASQPTVAATLAALDQELATRPAALLTVTGASNVTGECLPLAALADLAHRHGARLAVDGAQLVPHRRVDLAAIGIDYLAFSGHKLYAPFGAGALVGRRDWLDAAPAHTPGGGTVRSVGLGRVEWAPAPARHEGGTPNVVGVAALAQAARGLAARLDAAAHDEARLRARLVAGLAALGLSPLRFWADSADPVAVVSFVVPGFAAGQVAAYLSAEHGIGVRDGRFCAHPALAGAGVAAAVRVSFGLGSTVADLDALLTALRQLLGRGPVWSYAQGELGWAPTPETRHLPDWLGGALLAGSTPGCAAG